MKGAISLQFGAQPSALKLQMAPFRMAHPGMKKTAFAAPTRAGLVKTLDRIVKESHARQYASAVAPVGGSEVGGFDGIPSIATAKQLSDLTFKYPDAGKSDLALENKVYETLRNLENEVLEKSKAFNALHPKSFDFQRAANDEIFLISLICAIIFCVFLYNQYVEFAHELHFEIRDGIFGAGFYFLLGLHGGHVVIGTGMLAVLAYLSAHGMINSQSLFLRCTSLYVHLVDLVFVVLVFTVYAGMNSPANKALVGDLAPPIGRQVTSANDDGTVTTKEV